MKKRILEGALSVYKKRGIKFTMDDLASELGMSKKTIYTVFSDKGSLLYDLVDYAFETIKKSEAAVLENQDTTIAEKIRQILGAMPESYSELDLTQLYLYKDKYPAAYARINEHLENGWEMTHELLQKGVAQGVVKDINFTIFQMVYEAALERFIMEGELQKNRITYMEALNGLVDIMVDGILKE